MQRMSMKKISNRTKVRDGLEKNTGLERSND